MGVDLRFTAWAPYPIRLDHGVKTKQGERFTTPQGYLEWMGSVGGLWGTEWG